MMQRNIGFASLSLIFRGGANVALVVILARLLPIEQFGLFMFALATATILGLVVDYGFSALLLRDLAAETQAVSSRVGAATGAKLLLAAGGLLLCATLQFWPKIGDAELNTILILFLAQTAGSFGNLLLVPYKCRDRFDVEAAWTGIEAVGLVGLCGSAALLRGTASAAAIAFVGARLVFLLGTIFSYRRRFAIVVEGSAVWKELRIALPFGVHLFVGTAYLNIDTVLLREFVSLDQIGLYQSAIRLVVVLSMFFGVVNSVLIPRLAADLIRDPRAFVETARKSLYIVTAIGALAGLPMMVFPRHVLSLLYGASYATATAVVTIMGAVVIVRFFGAVYGIVLTVSGRQTVRAVAALLTLVVLSAADLWAIPRFGILGAAWVLLGAHVLLVATYVTYARVEHGTIFVLPYRESLSGTNAR